MSGKTTNPEPWAVVGRTSQGQEVRGMLAHMNGSRLVFETSDPWVLVRLSEVLDDFKVIIAGRELLVGRAVVTSAMGSGASWLCEVSLPDGWVETHVPMERTAAGLLDGNFTDFLRQWQSLYTVRPEFKIVLSDLQSLLTNLRLWLEAAELRLNAGTNGDRRHFELEILRQLDTPLVNAINVLHERFENIVAGLSADEHPAHQSLCRRLLHPLFLCSPFGHRTYAKPLGYAGDYEMVNMILRSPYEGPSLFAQAVNVWLLRQYPSQAHRNRIRYLTQKLIEEAVRISLIGRRARIFSLGCGPAQEIQAFLKDSVLSNLVDFTLLDFNQETINYTRTVLEGVKREHGRECALQFQKKSVISLLKEAVRGGTGPEAAKYDFVYCAGLFDYLPDRTCQQLMGVLYQWLAPGGLLVATNVFPCQPFRHMLEYLLDWRLIYRDPRQMQELVPAGVSAGRSQTVSDLTGTNLLLEIRKPVV